MYDVLSSNMLFKDISVEDIEKMLKCLDSREREYKKGEYVFMAGQSKPAVGVLLSGNAQVIKENFMGDLAIIGSLQAGDFFGETFALAAEKSACSVIRDRCKVIFLNIDRMTHTCKNSCPFHHQLISNLLNIVAQKNIILNRKISYLTHKTIRGRLTAYFYDCMEKANSRRFSIPFNRRELADYLCIDRSAMSRELSNMKKEGILSLNGRVIQWLEE